MRILIKIVGTAFVALLLTYPIWAPQWGSGILGEVWALGFPGGLVAIVVFFGLVAAYCRGLQVVLQRVRPEFRAATPASVWWMFAIPYNFVEDFFIIDNVGRSLRADGRVSGRTTGIWTGLGLLWCILQVVSLLPGALGYVGGALALVAWASHWILTARVNRQLVEVARVPDPVR